MMAPETSCCEENESLKISGNITRLLLDMRLERTVYTSVCAFKFDLKLIFSFI